MARGAILRNGLADRANAAWVTNMDSHSKLRETWTSLRRELGLELRRRRGGMRVLQALRIAAAPREFVARRRAAAEVLSGVSTWPTVDPELGYRRLLPGEIPGIGEIVARARELRERRSAVIPQILAQRTGKHRIVFDLLSDDELARRPEFVDFALAPELVRAATAYLDTVPILRRVGLGLSVADPAHPHPLHSQLFHLDGEDFAQLKLMVNVSTVERADGPFTFVDARATEHVRRIEGVAVRARVAAQTRGGPTTTPRFSDEEVARHVDPASWVRLEGPPGTAVLVDTSRCLHFGSRIDPGRERLVFGVVFQRYHLVNESPFNCFVPRAERRHEFEQLLFVQPRPVSRGTHFPEPFAV